MDQERSHIRAILRKYHFYRHPTESIVRKVFGDAAFGYMRGYVTRSFLGILAGEILLTNVREKRRFLYDKDLFNELFAASQLDNLRFNPKELYEIHKKLKRYEQRRGRHWRL
jgi:hypothetical protein